MGGVIILKYNILNFQWVAVNRAAILHSRTGIQSRRLPRFLQKLAVCLLILRFIAEIGTDEYRISFNYMPPSRESVSRRCVQNKVGRNMPISFVISVRPSFGNNFSTEERIFVKFGNRKCY